LIRLRWKYPASVDVWQGVTDPRRLGDVRWHWVGDVSLKDLGAAIVALVSGDKRQVDL
jgi:hypothetical protein